MSASNAAAEIEVVPPEDIEWINGFATPPAPPVRPFHAFAAVLKLIRNKEDTRQVFEAVSALSGGNGKKLFRRFTDTPYGRRVISEPVKLEEILSDRDALRALPEGSLGRAYLDFMEGGNLTADGLIDAAEEAGIDFRGETQFEDYRRLFLHLDVSHDLWHVLTGYGRDALGELCNLAYTHTQTRNPGFRLIIFIGLIAQKLEQPVAPLMKAVAEGAHIGRNAKWILEYDIEELLKLPLDEARRRLNMPRPEIYNAVPDEIKQNLLKPKSAQTQAERENLNEAQPVA